MARILLVEDNPSHRESLAQRLELRGYDVVRACDGAQAITCARSQLPNLIVMDMSLPVLDGPTAVEQLKALPETRQIPIIALTGHILIWDRQKCVAAGCDEYEVKPIDFFRLLAKIESLL